jgi:uncharacterized membrane protein YphA (DoxX/SURF4 family)
MFKQFLRDVVIMAFMVLFAYTAFMKFYKHEQFNNTIAKVPLLAPLSEFVAWAVPIVETIIVVLLFIPATRRLGLYAATALMAAFTFYIGYMLIFVPHLPCSCGGVLASLSWKQHIFFNMAFLLAGIWSLWPFKRPTANIEASSRLSLSR